MASGIIENIKISGMSVAFPKNKRVTMSGVAQFGESAISKLIKTTGVESTYCVQPGQTCSDLCYVAVKDLIEGIGWNPDSIDIIVYVSQAPDYGRPATACVLHGRLGLRKECVAFDINLGCSGFVYGMSVIGSVLNGTSIKRGILMTGDMSSTVIDKSSVNQFVFGDCGTATAVEYNAGSRMNFSLYTDGENFRNIISPGGGYRHPEFEDNSIYTNGYEVLRFCLSDGANAINQFIEDNKIDRDNIDILALHQINMTTIKLMVKKCKIPMKKVPLVLRECGNTVSSCIPLVVVKTLYAEKQRKKSCYVISSGFGIGMSWGVLDFNLDENVYIGMSFTDSIFNDELDNVMFDNKKINGK